MPNKIIAIVAGVALVVSLIGFTRSSKIVVYQPPIVADSGNDLGVFQGTEQFPNGLQIGNLVTKRKSGVIELGSNQASFQNTEGRTIFIDYVRLSGAATSTSVTGAVASSTMQIIVGTSTASTIGNYSTPNNYNGSLIQWLVATSTGSNSMTASSTISLGGYGAGSQKVVRVNSGDYVNIAILSQAAASGALGAPLAGCQVTATQNCETSTSTVRGFNLEWVVGYTYLKDKP